MSYSPAITLSYRVLDECSFIANSITNSGTISVICDIRNLVRGILVRNIDNELPFCLVICKYLVETFCNLYSVREIALVVKSSLPNLVIITLKYKLVTSLLFSECDVTCKLIFYLYLCLITSFVCLVRLVRKIPLDVTLLVTNSSVKLLTKHSFINISLYNTVKPVTKVFNTHFYGISCCAYFVKEWAV